MFRILKIELQRAFYNRAFFISLIIGCAVAIAHVISAVLPLVDHQNILPGQYSYSVFNIWMGLDYGFWTNLFFMIFPLLAALPFADSFFEDRKTGYVKNIFTRGNKTHYYTSKFISVFLSGGAAVAIPLLFDLYLTCLCVPAVIPDKSTLQFMLYANCPGAALHYTHPFAYVFISIFLIFIVSGIFTTFALACTFFTKYKYIVTIMPFLGFLSLSFLAMFFSIPSMDPKMWILPFQSYPINLAVVSAEMVAVLVFTIITYYFRGVRDDTY